MEAADLNPGDIVLIDRWGGRGMMLVQRIQDDIETGYETIYGRRWLLAGHLGVQRLQVTADEIIKKLGGTVVLGSK